MSATAHQTRPSSATASATAPPDTSPFFITTPIYYVNGDPHIGHAYTTLACDVIARFMRMEGREVKFLTGTDEHGQKVEQSACAAGETPQAFADRVSAKFNELTSVYDFSHDEFIRTTEPRHIASAQALWGKLADAGDIYLGEYEGWYSVRDESFYGEDELIDGKAPTGAPVEWVAESSYFFRLSSYTERLRQYILDNPKFIMPASRRNEVLAFMREGLRDLSISRTTFSWGVPVPDSAIESSELSHVMYVWLDALANYITAVGYPDTSSTQMSKFWPASLHMVGKDILRFHAIYWPAFLMAAGLPLPKRLFAHGWWTRDGEKMSKSVGNVVNPFDLVETYGCDQVRYFMVNEVAFGSDGDFSDSKMVDCINAKLSNDLGNLAYRTLSFAYKHCDKLIPSPGELLPEDEAMLASARDLLPRSRELIDQMKLHLMTQTINSVVQQGNRYIDSQAPWALRKSDIERMQTVLWVLIETLRRIALQMQPVTPSIASDLLDQLAVPAECRTFADLGPEMCISAGSPLPEPRIVVPRFEVPEELEDAAQPPAAAPAAPPPPALSEEELTELEAQVVRQGEAVRELKAAGDKTDLDLAIAELLKMKAMLPDGHGLKGGGKKKKKKK